MAHIYKITNTINDKGYVGKTIHSPEKRWKAHLYCAKTEGPMVISRAIRKHGEKNFKFEVIEECSVEEINSRETYWIDYHDTFHNGYNSSMGGEGSGAGVKRKRGAVHPHAKAVDCYDLEGNYLCTYNSKGEGAWETGKSTNAQCINFCIEGKTFQAFGYRWAWKGEPLKEVSNRVNRRGKVYGINLESGRKKMWESQADAAKEIHDKRRGNGDLGKAIERNDKEDTTKVQVRGWYLFRDKKIALGYWKPAEPRRSNTEEMKQLAQISANKRKVPMKGVNIKTGEIIHFNSMSEASFFIKGEGNYSATSGISQNLKQLKKGKNSSSFGYRWYYDG